MTLYASFVFCVGGAPCYIYPRPPPYPRATLLLPRSKFWDGSNYSDPCWDPYWDPYWVTGFVHVSSARSRAARPVGQAGQARPVGQARGPGPRAPGLGPGPVNSVRGSLPTSPRGLRKERPQAHSDCKISFDQWVFLSVYIWSHFLKRAPNSIPRVRAASPYPQSKENHV